MKLKTIDVNGTVYAEVQDGKPVYEAEDGKPIAFDAPATRATINRLNGEAKTNRERYEAAESGLKAFEGLDAAAARNALDLVKNYDDKQRADAGHLEQVKKEAKDAYERQVEALRNEYKPHLQERDSLRDQLHAEKLGGAFANSKYASEKLSIPIDMVRARFGGNFAIEDGKIRAKGPDGNLVYSRVNPGNPADFDEALEILVEAYPYRDSILKGTGASGGGAGGSRTNANGRKTVTRAQFDAMNPVDKAKAAREAEIVD